MKNIFLTLLCLCFLYSDGFEVTIDETGENALFIISGAGLQEGDQVGIFDAAGYGVVGCGAPIEEILVGEGTFSGSQFTIVAIAFVDQCTFGNTQLPGYVEGNPIIIKVYRDGVVYDTEFVSPFGSNFGDSQFFQITQITIQEDCSEGYDCAGVCGGDAVIDDCGVCDGGNADDLGCGCFEAGPSGCDNACDSTLEFDDCGVCGGDGSSCAVYIESELTTSVGEGELADLEVFEDNFEALLESQLALPEGSVEIISITIVETRAVEIIVEYTITLTEEELAETDFTDAESIQAAVEIVEEEIEEGVIFVEGCIDTSACNYDSDATIDDGSCDYSCYDNEDYSLNFDGIDDYVLIGNNVELSPSESLIIDFNIQLADDSDNDFIISKDNSNTGHYMIYLNNNIIKLRLQTSQGYNLYDTNYELELNKFYRITLSYNEQDLLIFVDNSLIFSQNLNQNLLTEGEYDLCFGTNYPINNKFFNGKIDNVSIWNNYNQLDYILSLQNFTGSEDGLVGYWRFNTGFGNILYDHSENNNHGAINGATWIENIYGCTDQLACNFTEGANWDDGSCNYIVEGECDCDGNIDLGCGCGEDAALTYYLDTDGDGLGHNGGLYSDDCIHLEDENCSEENGQLITQIWNATFNECVEACTEDEDCIAMTYFYFLGSMCRLYSECEDTYTCTEPGCDTETIIGDCFSDGGTEYCLNDVPEGVVLNADDTEPDCATNDTDCAGVCGGDAIDEGCGCGEVCSTTINYSLDLNNGPNLVSFYALPDNRDIGYIMSNLQGSSNGVIGEGEATQIINGEWQGSLDEIKSTSGYWIKMNGSGSLFIEEATLTDPNIMYNLHNGANLISFPYQNEVEIGLALPDNIESSVLGVIGQGEAAQIINGEWQGSLDKFRGGKGYWLKADGSLSFSFITEVVARDDSDKLVISDPAFNQSTKQAFYFIGNIDLGDINQSLEGSIIKVYNNNVLVGERYWEGSYTDVPAMGNDGSLETAGYCESGDNLSISIEFSDGSERNLYGNIPEWSSNEIFTVNDLYVSSSSLPSDIVIVGTYPNPFNPSTTISYETHKHGDLSVSVYNVKGQLVSQLYNGYQEAGSYEFEFNGAGLSSGMYIVKISNANEIQSQKLLLMK